MLPRWVPPPLLPLPRTLSGKYHKAIILSLVAKLKSYNAPELLRPPQLAPAKREELMGELRSLLTQELQETMQELGYPQDMANYQASRLHIENPPRFQY